MLVHLSKQLLHVVVLVVLRCLLGSAVVVHELDVVVRCILRLQDWSSLHLVVDPSKLNKSIASNLKSSHPTLKIHRTSVVFHELRKPIQEHVLLTFDEMWS